MCHGDLGLNAWMGLGAKIGIRVCLSAALQLMLSPRLAFFFFFFGLNLLCTINLSKEIYVIISVTQHFLNWDYWLTNTSVWPRWKVNFILRGTLWYKWMVNSRHYKEII